LSLILTGCGVPNAINDEIKNIDVGFVTTENEINQIYAQCRSDMRENKQEIVKTISPQREKQLKDMIAFLREQNDKGVFFEYAEHVGVEDGGGMFVESEGETESDAVTDYFQQEISWKETDNLADGFTFFVSVKVKTDLQPLVEGLKKIGYESLEKINSLAGVANEVIVSDGVSFTYMNGSENYVLKIEVKKADMFAPVQFSTIVSDCVENGYSAIEMTTGGYLDRIVLVGDSSVDKKQESRGQAIYIYLKEGKFLQMEIIIENRNKKEALFSENQKRTVENILTWVTGDAEASHAFVAGATTDIQKKGKVGNCNFYRINHREMKKFTLRFVEQ